MSFLLAIILGIVEGLTEFLPISSTGHLILVSNLFSYVGDKADAFIIFIQLGAIAAVVAEYWKKIVSILKGISRNQQSRKFTMNIFIAFLPAAIIGFLFHSVIEKKLFGPMPVAAALLVGAFLMIIVEKTARAQTNASAETVTTSQALKIGIAQCLSLWPGFSRSAATIMGGMAVGLDRKTATEFSFFLAIPTLGVATIYSLLKNIHIFTSNDAGFLIVGTVVSFVAARMAIKWLLNYVSTHSLKPFAWYRIALGLLVLLLLYR